MQEQIFVLSMLVALVAFPLITECTPVASVNGPIPPLCEPVSFNMEKLFFSMTSLNIFLCVWQGIIEEMPLRIKKVCMALGNSFELSAALTQYIRNEAAGA